MEAEQMHRQTNSKEDTYWRIWQTEQEHAKIRWNNATYFMSVSFAVLGFSFQSNLPLSSALAVRIFSLAIYWFAYILYLQFHRYSKLLRKYLKEMEISDYVSFTFQTRNDKNMRPNILTKLIDTTRLLLYFGMLYTLGVILLSLLRL